MDYKEVIAEFKKASNRYCLSDAYLAEEGDPTRENHPIAGEYAYGIVFVRDDAVELLIDRINELENSEKKKQKSFGKWNEENSRPKSFMFECSVCKRIAYDMPRIGTKGLFKKRCALEYCPHCGTKMKLEDE